MAFLRLVSFVSLAASIYAQQPLTVDLNGAWTVAKGGGGLDDAPFANATVPGQIHLDLLAMPDPAADLSLSARTG